MSIPTFCFLQSTAAQPTEPKRFTDALIASGRFYRDERGLLKYKVAAGDYLVVESRNALKEILLSGDALKMSGDLGNDDFAVMWLWFTSRKFAFPRLNPEKAWNPEKPLPTRNAGRGPWVRS